MNCEQSQSLLSARVDGELAPADCDGLDAHLHGCPACAGALESLRRQDAELRAVFAPRRQAVAALAEQVISQVRQSASPVRRRHWIPVVASLASAAAGFLAALFLLPPLRLAPLEQQIVERPVYIERDRPLLFERPVLVESEAAATQPRVELALATGRVEYWSPDKSDWLAMPTGFQLAVGTRVRTPPSVRCEFRCPDGSEVRLNGGTEMAFHAERKLQVNEGQLFSSVAKNEVPFEVSVPDATVTALGTEFDVICKAQTDTVLTVVEGRTRVDGKAGTSFVKQGEQARIRAGLVVHQDQIHDLVQATNWVHELLVLKGRDNKELAKRINALLAELGNAKMAYLNEPQIRSLGDHCVLPLARFVESTESGRDQEKRQRAMRILADLAQPWSIPDLIKLLDDSDKQVRYEAARALRRLVGQDYAVTIEPERWREPLLSCKPLTADVQKWWFDNRARYPGVPLPEERKKEIKSKE